MKRRGAGRGERRWSVCEDWPADTWTLHGGYFNLVDKDRRRKGEFWPGGARKANRYKTGRKLWCTMLGCKVYGERREREKEEKTGG